MHANQEAWNTHQWLTRSPREIEGKSAILQQRHCVRCLRDFLIDSSSGDVQAVHTTALNFYRLDEPVASRWLSEPCPGQRLALDDEDRRRFRAGIVESKSSEVEPARLGKWNRRRAPARTARNGSSREPRPVPFG